MMNVLQNAIAFAEKCQNIMSPNSIYLFCEILSLTSIDDALNQCLHRGPMLRQGRRRWVNIKTTLAQCLVFSGNDCNDLHIQANTRYWADGTLMLAHRQRQILTQAICLNMRRLSIKTHYVEYFMLNGDVYTRDHMLLKRLSYDQSLELALMVILWVTGEMSHLPEVNNSITLITLVLWATLRGAAELHVFSSRHQWWMCVTSCYI